MVHLTAKAFLQAQLQRRDEGLHHLLIDALGGVGHQDAQRLGVKLPVQIQAVDDARGLVCVALVAVKGMGLLRLTVIGMPGGSLHLAAVPAESEPGARAVPVGDFEIHPGFPQLTKIHVPEGRPGDELKAKRHISGLEPPGLPHLCGLEVDQQLAQVVARLAVLGAIVDAHPGVVAIGDGLAEAQQLAALRLITPHGVPTAWAGDMRIGLHHEVLHVVARRAQAPGFEARQRHVDLIDLDATLVGVEAVFRGKLGQR